jgi:iron-sulfur cluster assembly protein
MFTMTGSAVEAINQLTTAQKVQAEGSPRFTLDGAPEVGTALIIDVVARATEGDDVIETAGAQVFLARETPLQLAGKVLDVRKDIDGHSHSWSPASSDLQQRTSRRSLRVKMFPVVPQIPVLTSERDEPRTDLMTNRDSEPRPRTSAGQWNGADDGWRQR